MEKKKRRLKPQTLVETGHWRISPEAKALLEKMQERRKK